MPTSQLADSIEFSCTGCGRTLKVPTAAAGKRASCPQCNSVVTVPALITGPAIAPAPPPITQPPDAPRKHRDSAPPLNPAAATWVLPQPANGGSSSVLPPTAPPATSP